MTIAEMHINFRQYAQQMGMQNVRAILPEQIDILLNQSITDTVNQLIRENIGITNDRVVTDNSKIGQINAFRTLYDVREEYITFTNSYLKVTEITTGVGTDDEVTTTTKQIVNTAGENSDTTEDGVRTKITYSSLGSKFTYSPSDRIQGLIKHNHQDDIDNIDTLFGKYMFLVDMSINYTAVGSETINTAWYPVRIIDSAYLSDTLNDFVLKNRFRSPIACVYKDDTLELYIDRFIAGNTPKVEIKSGTSIIQLIPNKLRIDLIKYPAIVKFVEDISEGGSISCDLPESMHGDIVKHAVDLYRVAVSGSLQANQEAEQAQQRENVRNNYRNEGNNQ